MTERVDRALLARLHDVVGRATSAFDAYDYTTALEVTQRFFWEFCDDYLELVKERAYDERRRRRRVGARRPSPSRCTSSCVCSRRSCLRDRGGVVVVAVGLGPPGPWPQVDELGTSPVTPATLDAVAAALIGIRGAKSQAKVSMRHELAAVEFTGPEARSPRSGSPSRISCAPAGSPPHRRTSSPDDAELSVAATVAP